MRTEQEIRKDIDFHNEQLRLLQAELAQVRTRKSNSSRDSYRSRKKMLDYTSELFEKMLKPGDIVKVTGSRASPYRQVKEIVPSKWGCGSLVGATCYIHPLSGKITRIDEHNLITCGTNKITAVAQEGRWVTAKELADGSQRYM